MYTLLFKKNPKPFSRLSAASGASGVNPRSGFVSKHHPTACELDYTAGVNWALIYLNSSPRKGFREEVCPWVLERFSAFSVRKKKKQPVVCTENRVFIKRRLRSAR